MRHVIGIGLAVGLAAAVFFGAGWGYLRLLRIPVANGGASTLPAQGGGLLHDGNVLYAFAAVAGTALLAGIFIAVRQISPLAAGLPGLALIAWTVVYGFSVRRAVHYIPLRGDTFGLGFEAMLMNGVLAAAGLALVVPLFIPSRWRAARPDLMTPAEARDATQVLEPTTITPLITNDEWTTQTAPHWTNDPDE
ncbi:MAG TPA: hypothetical protein VHT26_23605 [Trebonia sp.]|jgi:hypothetical protein|nr:hypothetical protein [Trebonia sp.]